MVVDYSTYDIVYRNPNGDYVHGFKAHWGAPAYKWFYSGHLKPYKRCKQKKQLPLRCKILKLLGPS